MGDPLQEHEWGIHYRIMSDGSITGVREGDLLQEHERGDLLQEHERGIHYKSMSGGSITGA